MLATHGRPSTMMTLSAPSCATTQVPTIGSNVTGGLPTVSFYKSTFDLGGAEAGSEATTAAIAATARIC